MNGISENYGRKGIKYYEENSFRSASQGKQGGNI